ncbi:flagellar hook-associated protein FlgK [Salidesulfovibrio onnuriiensis]|uniref:flagellar hook-associated protein FlgK n=1 Tax=Salidesulfovibrio onnuriiensis TaxID=2583823 RepID=UPI0011C9349B|nr:flagellar hook-associated protein FlgK [Salidesulfovibrio onnuriiensis]
MISSLYYTGLLSLQNFQGAISIHGNNISNVDTTGYTRRTVEFTSLPSVQTAVGRVGTGSTVDRITRHLNEYLESQYNEKMGGLTKWSTASEYLSSLEALFTQGETTGISASLANFWAAWEDLSSAPGETTQRTTLVSETDTLISLLASTAEDLEYQQLEMEQAISEEVDEINDILEDLAALNAQIPGQTDNLELLDTRDYLVRALAQRVDVQTIEQEDGQITVLTGEGLSLVDGDKAYTFSYESAQSSSSLYPTSDFDGSIYFEGSSNQEFTIEVVNGGYASGGGSAATFKVSLDGGKTWLTDDDGEPVYYTAGDTDNRIEIGGVEIWFGDESDSGTMAGTELTAGDQFTIVAKSAVYWESNSSGKVNVTPFADTTSSGSRLSGGSLAGMLIARDSYLGDYTEQLDAFASSLIWEVNYAHSQGAGLDHWDYVLGSYQAQFTDRPISESGLDFEDYIEEGSFSLAIYDEDTGELLSNASVDFSSISPGISYFDPTVHSMEDVCDAIEATFPGQIDAEIIDGRLSLEAADGTEFEFAGDSSGLLAGLGINTYFDGHDAASISINTYIEADSERVNAGHVNGAGEVNEGDNTIALALAELATKEVTITTIYGSVEQDLQSYFDSLVSEVGGDVSTASTNAAYYSTLAEDLAEQQEEVSGVNIDEELTMLMRYQQSYAAAAKMITTASELFDIVLALKS